jgi:hypothetical protein
MRDRIRGLAEKAIGVIESHLKENSLQAAVAVLKTCDFLDPTLIRQEMEERHSFLTEAEARERDAINLCCMRKAIREVQND